MLQENQSSYDSTAPAHTTTGQTAELGCPEQTGETAHPSVDGTHGVTINFEILCAIFLDEIGHFCQVCHVLSGVRHLDITEAFDRNLGQLGLASIGQLASPGGTHAPQVDEIQYLIL